MKVAWIALLALTLTLLGGCAHQSYPPEPASSAAGSSAEGSAAESAAASVSAEASESSAPSALEALPRSPNWVQALPQAEQAHQLFVVAALDRNTAQVTMHQRDEHGAWRELLRETGRIGKNGLGKTQEGDGKTPVGTFRFNRAFGIAADPGCAIPYVRVDGNSYWSGDQREGMRYNELVDLRELPDLDTSVSEHIEDFWDEYQYCLNISYNEDGTPGRGSAIFLHCFGSSPYTGGCVALPQERVVQVLRQVDPGCVVVIDSLENLGGA